MYSTIGGSSVVGQSNSTNAWVLHVGPSVGSQGGMASVIEELTRPSESHRYFETRSFGTWKPNRSIWSLGRAAYLSLKLCVQKSERRPSLLHIHLSERGSFIREGVLFILSSRLRFVRVVATLHGASFQDFARRNPRLTKFVLARLELIFCLGPNTASFIQDVLKISHVEIVSNPISDEIVVDSIRAVETAQGSSKRSLLFVGELGLRKGFDRVARIWPKVVETFPDALLIACGPIARNYEIPVLPNFSYRGVLRRAELTNLYRSSTLLCLASREEVLPMCILECLSQGTKVVATDCGEVRSLEGVPGVTVLSGEGDVVENLLCCVLESLDQQRDEPVTKEQIVRGIAAVCRASIVRDQLDKSYQRLIGSGGE